MFDDFLTRALLAGIGTAVAAGPLGAFVLWRRMAYFGDATAHAALLGVALAIGFSTSILAATLAVALLMALAVTTLTARGHTSDSTLGVLSHAALALGLVAFALLGGAAVDLNSFLFGDILAVRKTDLAVIWTGAALVAALIAWRWQALLTATINAELATSTGIDPRREHLIITLALAITVAVALKVIGALLIGAMLIIPAAAARSLARSPDAMVVIAIAIGAAASALGLGLSWQYDLPAGPAIVSAAAGLYALSLLKRP